MMYKKKNRDFDAFDMRLDKLFFAVAFYYPFITSESTCASDAPDGRHCLNVQMGVPSPCTRQISAGAAPSGKYSSYTPEAEEVDRGLIDAGIALPDDVPTAASTTIPGISVSPACA